MRLARWSFPLFLIACGTMSLPGSERHDGSGSPQTPAGSPPSSSPSSPASNAPFVVHEWGTFTSMAGSSGAPLAGLQHEEAPLPSFVHQRAMWHAAVEKGAEAGWDVAAVTQKLETPVLFFYSPVARDVHVHVDFPLGIVSQWYPDASSWGPPLVVPGADPLTPSQGTMDWAGRLVPGEALTQPSSDPVWAPSQRVPATPFHYDLVPENAHETEQFIFYRGVGSFTVPLRVTGGVHAVTLENPSPDAISAAFLLAVDASGGAFASLGALGAGSARADVALPALGAASPLATYAKSVSDAVAAALVDSGLTPEESRAMVETWSASYFTTPGARLLYVVPRAWTDALLPLRIDPRPDQLVRTLVGRVEILTRDKEDALVAQITRASKAQSCASPADYASTLGRFVEPGLRRATELLTDPAALACAQLLLAASWRNP